MQMDFADFKPGYTYNMGVSTLLTITGNPHDAPAGKVVLKFPVLGQESILEFPYELAPDVKDEITRIMMKAKNIPIPDVRRFKNEPNRGLEILVECSGPLTMKGTIPCVIRVQGASEVTYTQPKPVIYRHRGNPVPNPYSFVYPVDDLVVVDIPPVDIDVNTRPLLEVVSQIMGCTAFAPGTRKVDRKTGKVKVSRSWTVE